MSKNDETFGEVIDLTDVSKARRGAEATYEQGILSIHLPKAESDRPRRITVKSS